MPGDVKRALGILLHLKLTAYGIDLEKWDKEVDQMVEE